MRLPLDKNLYDVKKPRFLLSGNLLNAIKPNSFLSLFHSIQQSTYVHDKQTGSCDCSAFFPLLIIANASQLAVNFFVKRVWTNSPNLETFSRVT